VSGLSRQAGTHESNGFLCYGYFQSQRNLRLSASLVKHMYTFAFQRVKYKAKLSVDRILTGKVEKTWLFSKPRCRWEDNVKRILKNGNEDWFNVTLNRG